MRVFVCGSDVMKVNEIAILTFLEGMYVKYKNDLHISFTGSGHVSDIVEKWVDATWPAVASKNSFNMIWYIEDIWSDVEFDGVAYKIIDECKPDLVFQFGTPEYKISKACAYYDIPTFIVSKES